MSPSETIELERLLHLAQYRATWQHLQAAVEVARALPRDVPPEAMAELLVDRGEWPETDDHILLSLIAWLRHVAAAHERERGRPAVAGTDAPWTHPLRDSGLLPRFPQTERRAQPERLSLAGD